MNQNNRVQFFGGRPRNQSDIMFQPKDTIPVFKLDAIFDGKIEEFTLSSLSDKKVLILFYPVDFGFVSPSEFYQISDKLEEFKKLNCEVIAVSTEHIPSMQKFLASPMDSAGLNNIPIRLVSDPTGQLIDTVGIFKKEENVAFPSVFLLGPNLELLSYEKFDFPIGCDIEAVLTKLQENEDICFEDAKECSTCELTSKSHGDDRQSQYHCNIM